MYTPQDNPVINGSSDCPIIHYHIKTNYFIVNIMQVNQTNPPAFLLNELFLFSRHQTWFIFRSALLSATKL